MDTLVTQRKTERGTGGVPKGNRHEDGDFASRGPDTILSVSTGNHGGRGFDHPRFGEVELDYRTHRHTRADITLDEHLRWIMSRTNANLHEAERILLFFRKAANK